MCVCREIECVQNYRNVFMRIEIERERERECVCREIDCVQNYRNVFKRIEIEIYIYI